MLGFAKTRALLLGACFSVASICAFAQEDLFAPYMAAPPELTELFADVSVAPTAELAETVVATSTARTALGGEARAHVLLSLDEPLTAARHAELADNGIRILDKYDESTWIAAMDLTGADFAVSDGPVRGATIYPPQAKVSETISLESPYEWQRREDSEALGYTVLFHKGISADEAAGALSTVTDDQFDTVDNAAFPYVRSLTVTLTSDELVAVTQLDVVQFVEPEAPPNIDQNFTNTQPISNVDDVQNAPYNLSGIGVTVGVWEHGDTVRATHVDLAPRVTVQANQTTSQDGHALHVSGTIGASGVNFPAAEGMAPQIDILSWDADGDTAEMAVAAAPGSANRIVASNHSYGATIGWRRPGPVFIPNQDQFGRYTARSVAFDTIVAGDGVSVAGTDLVIVKSAGNDRGNGQGFGPEPADCRQGGLGIDADCIGPVASAKNVITVGAMNGGASVAHFSGFGPTDDGRIKPDIMANGTNVRSLGDASATTDDIPQTDDGTWVAQGTSMSAPAVTGIVSLLNEELSNLALTEPPSAAAIKAILIQTARDVAGTDQATVGPDYATGWGIADAQAAADLVRRQGGPGFAEGTVTDTGLAGAWEFPFVVPAGEADLRVTLAWSDLPGIAEDAASDLRNDLDLRLIPPGTGAPQQPWTLDPTNPGEAAVRNGGDDATNNVEQVLVIDPADGTWLARVTAKPNSLGLGPQRFAIAGPITPDT